MVSQHNPAVLDADTNAALSDVLASAIFLRGLLDRVLMAGDKLLAHSGFTPEEWRDLVKHDRTLREAGEYLTHDRPPAGGE